MRYIYIIGLLFLLSLESCDSENEFLEFNTEEAYLYFDMPKKLNSYNRVTSKRTDSLEYSFALDMDDVRTHTFKVPIAISGNPADVDRSYKVEIVAEDSDVIDLDWEQLSLENLLFKKGLMFDTLLVTVNRTEILKTEKRKLSLKIVPNDEFEEGREDLLSVKLIFSDILIAPVWWEDWKNIFGTFYLETYLKWQEIYYEGVDPNITPSYMKVSGDKSKPYYWDNMPVGYYAGTQRYTPSVFMFISKLRDYFEKNEVYGTNPDGSKTKIKIF